MRFKSFKVQVSEPFQSFQSIASLRLLFSGSLISEISSSRLFLIFADVISTLRLKASGYSQFIECEASGSR